MTDPINRFKAAFNALFPDSTATVVGEQGMYTVYTELAAYEERNGVPMTKAELSQWETELIELADKQDDGQDGDDGNLWGDVWEDEPDAPVSEDDIAAELDAEKETGSKPDDALDRQLAELGTEKMLGMIVWYSIHGGSYPIALLRKAADAANVDGFLPSLITDYLAAFEGETPDAAFNAVTRTGVRGLKTIALNAHEKASIHTDAIPDVDGARVVYIKTVAKDGEDDGEVQAEQAGILLHDPDGIEPSADGIVWKPEPAYAVDHDAPGLDNYMRERLLSLANAVATMRHEYQDRIGKINDVQIRQSLILPWLAQRYRISLRGKGGVYLVPLREEINETRMKERQTIQAQIYAFRDFLERAQVGTLTAVGVFNGKATTIDFQRSAIAEITDEIADINAKLDSYGSTPPGSRKAAVNRMIARLGELQDRIAYYNETLGDDLQIKGMKIDVLTKRATAMVNAATAEIAAAKQNKKTGNLAPSTKQRKAKHVRPSERVNTRDLDDDNPIIIAGKSKKKSL